MKITTIEELRESGRIIYEAICGSMSFGLATKKSDMDIHGVYVATPEMLSNIHGTVPPIIKDPNSDTEYWEVRHFMKMLMEGKPNALELLYSPRHCILYRHQVMDRLQPYDQFISKACDGTFYRYAMSQVEKARGQNKKIVNPMPEKRKSVLDFCYFMEDGKTRSLLSLGAEEDFVGRGWGLAAINHAPYTYALYKAPSEGDPWAHGIIRNLESSNEVCLSSVPKGVPLFGYVVWNKDGYTMHCKQHREYWEWVKNRNPVRYEGTVSHGKGYDAKNMMHTMRLLHVGLEISKGEGIRVDRTHERDYLLSIKRGDFEFDGLLEKANAIVAQINDNTKDTTLPEPITPERAEEFVVILRSSLN